MHRNWVSDPGAARGRGFLRKGAGGDLYHPVMTTHQPSASQPPPTSPGTPAPTPVAFDPEARLAELGLTLPPAPKPVAAYIPSRRSGSLLFVSGQIPMREGKLIAQGRVPGEVPLEVARECARQCVLNALAVVKASAGTLAAVRQVVRVGVFVCCEPGFHAQPQVANGASELLVQVFGERGQHARAAVGSIDLPLGAPVEVEFVFEIG